MGAGWGWEVTTMDTNELVVALLYIGFQLQTKAANNQSEGGYIAGYRDFKKEYERDANEKWQKR
jgi:hypothetical protein